MKFCTISDSMDITCSPPARNDHEMMSSSNTCSAAKTKQLGQEYQTFMRNENFERFCEMVGAL